MKTPLFVALSLLTGLTLSAQVPTPPGPVGNSLRLEIRNPLNTGFSSYWLTFPGSNSFLVWDNSVNLPRMATLDSVFSYAGGSANQPLSIDFTGLDVTDYGLGSAAAEAATSFQAASSYLDELVALGQNPDRAVRTDGSGDFVSETPTNFLSWLNGVSATGSYANPSWLSSLDWSKITGAPSIPAAQVNSDWTSGSGVSQILNKPVLGTAAAQNTTAFATAAQGSLAASALQPGANNSLLNNNAGYVTAVTAPVTSVNSQTGSVVLTKSSVGLGNVDNTSDLAKPISTATATALSGKFNTPVGTTSQYVRGDGSLATLPSPGSGTVTSVGVTSSTLSVSGSPVTSSGSITINTPALSFGSPTRTLNSAFQISTTRNAFVSYSIDIATVVSLVGGQVGTVFLEYADDSGFTTNVVEAARFVNGQTGTLVVGLTLNQTATGTLTAIVPASKYTRIRTANTTGTPTFNWRSGQEVQI